MVMRELLRLIVRSGCCAVVLMSLAVATAMAQGMGTGAPSGDQEWTFQAGVYGFMPGIKGDVGVRGVSAEADVGFNQIWDNLDMAAMGFAEAHRDKFSFLVDVDYLALGADQSRVSQRGFVQANLDMNFKQLMAAGYATYTIIDRTINANSDQRVFNLDVVGGGRYNWIESELGFSAAGLRRSGAASADRTVDWIDPVIGLRATYVPYDNWFVSVWADVGGFGVGSQQTYQLIGTVGYRFENGLDLFAAYRSYHFKYETGSGADYLDLDLTYTGPELGLAYRF
jgi:hypothetical protein